MNLLNSKTLLLYGQIGPNELGLYVLISQTYRSILCYKVVMIVEISVKRLFGQCYSFSTFKRHLLNNKINYLLNNSVYLPIESTMMAIYYFRVNL